MWMGLVAWARARRPLLLGLVALELEGGREDVVLDRPDLGVHRDLLDHLEALQLDLSVPLIRDRRGHLLELARVSGFDALEVALELDREILLLPLDLKQKSEEESLPRISCGARPTRRKRGGCSDFYSNQRVRFDSTHPPHCVARRTAPHRRMKFSTRIEGF